MIITQADIIFLIPTAIIGGFVLGAMVGITLAFFGNTGRM